MIAFRKPPLRQCRKCGNNFTATGRNHVYCGSFAQKTGCAYVAGKKLRAKRSRSYRETKRPCIVRGDSSPAAKAAQKRWRRRNYGNLYAYAHARKLKIRMLPGTHTLSEWLALKTLRGFCCTKCGRNESAGHGLTRDHIIPISKGGSNNIQNIQPLCRSCNSRKKDSITSTIACVSGGMDCLHIGHVRLITEAAKYGPVVVILNSDDWLVKKKGYRMMPWKERAQIILALKNVIAVTPVNDADGTVSEAIYRLRPTFFCNGGDREEANAAEHKACLASGTTELFNIGGGKIKSSSQLVNNLKGKLT